ncbi:STAS domain-containing protein [Teredinibacter turnerae]|uniref:Anti-anti-sigma factor n=1 Tax=Teredinibacter turnerae (strain ATCC 39867 / T7901) TaxID=377629 RepID=C5BR06_TERTT|nr:STAS domain-containing protein [Teredinibacter turnerae]ACR13631.1 anti-anti-sigma factor [Teredinibacter turnerae T7901]
MSSGEIKVAEHNGVYVIKMEGDVRLTLCLSFDEFIEQMFDAPDFCSVVFDLSDALAIDSTTLGLMAKISIKGRALHYDDPTVVSNNPSITRLLSSMGFEDIFNIVDSTQALRQLACKPDNPVVLDEKVCDEQSVQARVIEAHKLLMAMNAANHDTFRELVDTLENSAHH